MGTATVFFEITHIDKKIQRFSKYFFIPYGARTYQFWAEK